MNSERKNYPMKEFRKFFWFHRFWSSGPGITNICLRKCTYAYFGAITYVVCKYMFSVNTKVTYGVRTQKNKIHFNPFSFFDWPMSVADTNAPRLFRPIRDNLRAETEVPTAVVATPLKQGWVNLWQINKS